MRCCRSAKRTKPMEAIRARQILSAHSRFLRLSQLEGKAVSAFGNGRIRLMRADFYAALFGAVSSVGAAAVVYAVGHIAADALVGIHVHKNTSFKVIAHWLWVYYLKRRQIVYLKYFYSRQLFFHVLMSVKTLLKRISPTFETLEGSTTLCVR